MQRGAGGGGQPLGPGRGAPAQPGACRPGGWALSSSRCHRPPSFLPRAWPLPLPEQGGLPLSTSSEPRPAARLQETWCLQEAPPGGGGLGAGTPRSPRGSQAEPGPTQQPGCEGIFRGEINSLVVQRPGSEPGGRDEAGRAARGSEDVQAEGGDVMRGMRKWAESRGWDVRIRPCQCVRACGQPDVRTGT